MVKDFCGVSLPHSLILAPMAGVTDRATRHMALSHSCPICTTEMVSVEGLIRSGKGSLELLNPAENEEHLIVQLFGKEPDSFSRASEIVARYSSDHSGLVSGIDINCGCPVPKVTRHGAGCAMMQTPEDIPIIINAVKRASGMKCGVKFRLGWDEGSINYLEFAKFSFDGGANWLTLHPRTRSQGYSGVADWSKTATLVAALGGKGVPIIASGDIFAVEDVDSTNPKSVFRQTGVDIAMVARGFLGNPEIFELKSPSNIEKVRMLKCHLELLDHYFGPSRGAGVGKKFIGHYLKGISNVKEVKMKMLTCDTIGQQLALLEDLLENL